jgi:hypothetical protein
MEQSTEILDENLLYSTQNGAKVLPSLCTAKTTQEWLWDKSLNVLKWPSQSQELYPSLWGDLKIAFEKICREEWEKVPKYRCAKLGASYPRRLNAVITAKGASKYQRCFKVQSTE